MEPTTPDPDIHFIQLVSTQPFPAWAVRPDLLDKVVEATVPKKKLGCCVSAQLSHLNHNTHGCTSYYNNMGKPVQ